MPKLRITLAEPPQVLDGPNETLTGVLEEHELKSKSLIVFGPLDGKPRVKGVEVARVEVSPRYTGHTFDELERRDVIVGGHVVTVTGEKRPFIGKVSILR